MGEWIGKAIDTLFSALGSPTRGDRALRRDLALGVIVAVAEFVAAGPALYVWGGSPVPSRIWIEAAIALSAAVGLSLLSPNWDVLLAGGWIFLGFRSLIALALGGGGSKAILLGLLFIALAAGCLSARRLRPGWGRRR